MKPDTTFAIIAIIVAIVVTASTVSKVAYGASENSASPFSPGKGTGEPPGQIIGPSAPNAPGHVKAAPQ